MSTKTIALESGIYRRLALLKRDGESFSKVIDRLLTEVANAHTGQDILQSLDGFSRLTERDAERFLTIVAEDRAGERWER
jgi:predicted CopG family antitoxin